MSAAARLLALALLCAGPRPDALADLAAVLDGAGALQPLETVLVARHGEMLAARGYRGHGVDDPTNIKSASKAIVSALTGIAIDRGVIADVGAPRRSEQSGYSPEHCSRAPEQGHRGTGIGS